MPDPTGRVSRDRAGRFGEALRAERERQGLAQEAIGFEAELDRTYVSGVERGVRNPTLAILQSWCRALRMRPSAVLRRAEDAVSWD